MGFGDNVAIADGDGPAVRPSIVQLSNPVCRRASFAAVAALSSAVFFRDAATKHYGLRRRRDSPGQAAWRRILTSRGRVPPGMKNAPAYTGTRGVGGVVRRGVGRGGDQDNDTLAHVIRLRYRGNPERLIQRRRTLKSRAY